MQKIFSIIISIVLLFTAAQAFAKDGRIDKWKNYTKNVDGEYTPYKLYFQDYFERLEKEFQPQTIFPKKVHTSTNIEFRLHKDGSISDFKITDSSMDDHELFSYRHHPLTKYRTKKYEHLMDDYVLNIFNKVERKPFPENMQYYEYLLIDFKMGYLILEEDMMTDLCGIERENYVTKKITSPEFCIYIWKDSR